MIDAECCTTHPEDEGEEVKGNAGLGSVLVDGWEGRGVGLAPKVRQIAECNKAEESQNARGRQVDKNDWTRARIAQEAVHLKSKREHRHQKHNHLHGCRGE